MKKAYVGYKFDLRRAIFMKPEKDVGLEDGVATLRNVLSFAEMGSRVDDDTISELWRIWHEGSTSFWHNEYINRRPEIQKNPQSVEAENSITVVRPIQGIIDKNPHARLRSTGN